ncbi:hypothetical protein [Parapedobacter sp. 10938]|uniref:hypothetical protein n=1 Tax=Parapedobacter flavus TaxID=3110225 RepID=UPI002DBE169E|nr:hypothetical protein [Parapedobacter sp. 10938]MEC3881604.1 hypothetical protein [Parapedobacter sp. 10938]
MLKHLENTDGRPASVEGSLAAIAHIFMKVDESGLLDRLLADYGCPSGSSGPQAMPVANAMLTEPPSSTPFVATDEDIDSGRWMSRKEAWLRLGVVKSTLEEMIKSGELAAYHKSGDQHKKKPRIWLKQTDVEQMYKRYTLRKGKEKK